MTQDLIDLALGANRVLTYAGYVLIAGTLTFWSVVWPDGRRNPAWSYSHWPESPP
jgi:hypothetical protein